MSKRSQRKRKQERRQSRARQFRWVLLAAGGLAASILVALVVAHPWSSGGPQATPQVAGSPRLTVDQTIVNEGYKRYDVPVRTTFHLRNVGDQPLKILDAPQVRLVDGC